VGLISLLALAVAHDALYGRRLAGAGRKAFVISAVIARALNVFVVGVQRCPKRPALMDIAPTQTAPPVASTPAIVLVVCSALGMNATSRLRDGLGRPI
jgi:hypothetical protein